MIYPQTTSLLRRSFAPIALGLLAALGLALLLAVGWMGVRGQDFADLVLYLAISGAISLLLGALGLVWFRRGNVRLWLQITSTYTLGVAVAILNIFLTAKLMFISIDHDLPLLVLLLLFAAVVSLALGYALAQALAQRVTTLHAGARALANGQLHVRVDESGSDELAALAAEFNRMAAQLATAAAERSQMEQSRRDLFAAISHDLRTPLASLRVMTEALSDGLIDDPATTARYFATMRGQIAHLSSLIDDLFELAQIDAGALQLQLQRVGVPELVGDVIAGMHAQAEARGIQLSCTIAPDLAPALAAPQKIARVLENLIGNAIRHTPSGGDIQISVQSDLPDQSALAHSAAQPAQRWLTIEVADSGEGIAAEDLPHIFEHFYRGEKSRSRVTGGAGLGLAIARGIVEAHGGQIWASSAPGHGTCMRFTLLVAS